ncbi:MAG TPA: glutamate--tRNA ligase [Bacteroidia bacterium]|nr:glutamate--tRNA ligase [Bacteroidia bacterium]HNL34244.1 glutamate--tRNA ligase [Bacteroidia bacterium]HRR23083.1 glutamate--tRNA ligase [Bacteroidia bacterium]HRU16471.1 glutamate--tRNA ligase [Bacteroidia bacterium]
MQRRIRTRFAPSPTGPLHMGGVRTALYAWLFAKKNAGDFLLRIEDTDQNRFVPGAEQYIIDALHWCGITIDEGVSVGGTHTPYRQSERKEIYRSYAMQLVESGNAYYAFDTAHQLEQQRKNAEEKKETFSYGSATRMKLNNSLALSVDEVKELLSKNVAYAIRLKIPENETITFTDLIRGVVSFDSNLVDDKVLLKSDGMPTYHLAHIVDDYLMEITHAIRGEEWLPSAPAHILIYRYLGLTAQMPHYAHLPLLLKPDGKGKLSKRDGDRLGFPVFPLEWKDPSTGEVSSGYRESGYYPEAFVNMLAMLGWNPGTAQEIFNMNELIAAFSLDHVHKAGARFDLEKTKWYNTQWMLRQPNEAIAKRIKPMVATRTGISADDVRLSDNYLTACVALLKPRVQFEKEMPEKGIYLFKAPSEYDQTVISKKWKTEFISFFKMLSDEFMTLQDWSSQLAEQTFKTTAEKNNIKPGEVLQLFRVFVSGQAQGVDLFPMIQLLGKDEVIKRLETALKFV